MQEAVTRTSASVGSLPTESGTFSTRTSPAPYMRVARIRCVLRFVFRADRVPGGREMESWGRGGRVAAGSGGSGAGDGRTLDTRDGERRGAAALDGDQGDGGDQGQCGDDASDNHGS